MICTSEYTANEQARFENLFRRAARNMKDHPRDPRLHAADMLIIGLPSCVSLGQARRWLEAKLSREHSSLTAVMLLRTQVVSEVDESQTAIVHEVALVPNPNARPTWAECLPDGRTPQAQFVVGRISTEDTRSAIMIGDHVHYLSGRYVFQQAQIFHERMGTGGNLEHNFRVAPGTSCSLVFRPTAGSGQLVVAPIAAPDDLLRLV